MLAGTGCLLKKKAVKRAPPAAQSLASYLPLPLLLHLKLLPLQLWGQVSPAQVPRLLLLLVRSVGWEWRLPLVAAAWARALLQQPSHKMWP